MIVGLDWKIGVIVLEVAIVMWGVWFFLGKPTLRNVPRTIVDKLLSVFRRQKTNDHMSSSQGTSIIESIVESMDKRLSVIENGIIDVTGALKIVDGKPKSVFDELSRKNERKGLSENDKILIVGRFDDLNEQIAQINENLEKTGRPSDTLLKAIPSLDALKDALGIIQTLKATEQAHMFSDIDKEFFTKSFSQLSNQIDVSIKNALIDNSQIEELSRLLNVESDKFMQKLKEVLDAQGYKECVNCSYSVVPKNAKFCPNCGQSPDIKTASEST